MRIVSCDPGKGGSLSLINNGQPMELWDMPIDSKGKLVDLPALSDILRSTHPEVGVVEQVGSSPSMGNSSSFNFGGNYRGVIGVYAGLGIPCFTITPQKWKTFHGLLNKPKDAARLKVIEMFPQLIEQLKRKKDVDRADALLLGLAWWNLYGRKM